MSGVMVPLETHLEEVRELEERLCNLAAFYKQQSKAFPALRRILSFADARLNGDQNAEFFRRDIETIRSAILPKKGAA